MTTKIRPNVRNVAFLAVVACVAVALDQLVKSLMRQMLVAGPLEFIPGVLRLVLVENPGAAFSMGEGASGLFAFVAIGVTLASLAWVWVDAGMPLSLVLGLACVCGGGVGNLIDRVCKASVTDFLATEFIDFPVFNVADCFITCGVVIAFVAWCAYDKRREAEGGDIDGKQGR